MSHERFLIRSRTSSNNQKRSCALVLKTSVGESFSHFVLTCYTLILSILFFGCAEKLPQKPLNKNPLPQTVERERPPLISPPPPAPWEVWSSDGLGDRDLEEAENNIRMRRFDLAIASYQRAEENSFSPEVREEALVRRLGTVLKLGRSKEVLDIVTEYMQKKAIAIDEVHPGIAFIISFAYQHQGDFDQSLAWLGVSHRRSQGEIKPRALVEAKKLIATLSSETFESAAQKWSSDGFISPIFATERLRRTHGGVPIPQTNTKWFAASTYLATGAQGAGQIVESDLIPSEDQGSNGRHAIGVILPLSGSYEPYGKRVAEGIELANEFQSGEKKIEFFVYDTGGNPESAGLGYENLVKEQHVQVVLGPLLAESTERVSQKARELGVPFISFTKRKGVPELGREAFRLGATAENQVEELVRYARETLLINSFAIIYPQNGSGEEFYQAFKGEVKLQGGILSGELSYLSANDPTLINKLATFAASPPEAVFLPDTIENLWPILRDIRGSSLQGTLLLGPAVWDDPVALRGASSLLEGAVYVTPFFRESARPEVVQFIEKYQQKFSKSPDLLAAQGYDAALLSMGVISQLSSPSPMEFIKKLESADTHKGVTGRLEVTKVGDIVRRMSVVRLVKGEKVEVMAGGEVTGFILDETKDKPTLERQSPENPLPPAR